MTVKGHSDAGTSCSRRRPTGNGCSCVLRWLMTVSFKKKGTCRLSFSFSLSISKKERIGSCVPLCELHLFATSCYKNRSYGFSQRHVFSHSVSQIKAFFFFLRSSATSRESMQHWYVPTENVCVRCSYTSRRERRLYCLTCSFLPPAERCELSAAVVGGVRHVLWEAHRCAVTGASAVSSNTCLFHMHTTRPAAPTGFYCPEAGWPLTLCGDMVLTCLCFV